MSKEESWQKCLALFMIVGEETQLVAHIFELKDVLICVMLSDKIKYNSTYNSPVPVPAKLVEAIQNAEVRQLHYFCSKNNQIFITNPQTLLDNAKFDKPTKTYHLDQTHWKLFSGRLPYTIPEMTDGDVLNPEDKIKKEPKKKIEPYIVSLPENDPLEALSVGWTAP